MFAYDRFFDVIVAGGGVSGAAAAVAAGRCGARVLTIEQNGFLGGALTACGVGPMMTFHAGGKQVIRGVMQEIVDRMAALGFCGGHIADTTRYVRTLTPFEPEGLKLVLDRMLAESGCEVLFHTAIGAVLAEEDRIASLTVCNKDGLHALRAGVFIDATGDGDVMAWSGAPHTKGRPEDGAAQPLTMTMKYCQVDTGLLKQYVLSHLEDFPRLEHNLDLIRADGPFALAGFDRVFAKARAQGQISVPREDILMFETHRKGEYIVNTTRILGVDATDADALGRAEQIGREQCAQLDAFFRKHVPGFENALLEFTGPSVGVRGSRQLQGCYRLTQEDILSRKRFSSVVAHSAYPIDIHSPDGEGTHSAFLHEEGAYYSIPYEIMVSPRFRNLIVAGRCVSATFEAQAAIRTTPTAGAIGQAAGVAAAQCALNGGDVRTPGISALQKALLARGAYLDVK